MPLRPELVLLGEERHITVDSLLEPQRMDAALLWLVLFFTAFHLPNLSLAESRAGRTIDALVVTSAEAMNALLNPTVLLSFGFWLTIGCCTLIYLGVSFVIASWSGSVASASIGAMIYLFCSGLLFTATNLLPDPFGTMLSQYAFAEGSILQSLHTLWNSAEQALHGCWGPHRLGHLLATRRRSELSSLETAVDVLTSSDYAVRSRAGLAAE